MLVSDSSVDSDCEVGCGCCCGFGGVGVVDSLQVTDVDCRMLYCSFNLVFKSINKSLTSIKEKNPSVMDFLIPDMSLLIRSISFSADGAGTGTDAGGLDVVMGA